MRTKLTKRSVESFPSGQKRYDVFDTELPGFHVRVSTNGKRTYQLYYRTKSGQERRPKIGQHGAITCEQAREIARSWLAQVAIGGDPSHERTTDRRSLTVADLCDLYLNEHGSTLLKSSTRKTYGWLCERLIKPALGARKITELKKADIERLHRSLAKTPRNANQAVSLLSTMLNYAEGHGMIAPGTNPCSHIKAYKSARLERFLDENELARLHASLNKFEREGRASPHAIAAIRLLLATGARKNEICGLKWAHVDLDRKELRLPDSKTGAKRILLNDAACGILAALPKVKDNPFVIAGSVEGQPLKGLQKIWERVRKEADLEDVRIHDFRHSFASELVSKGYSLPIVGRLLGHSSLQATQRYAHLADASLRDAVECAGDSLSAKFRI